MPVPVEDPPSVPGWLLGGLAVVALSGVAAWAMLGGRSQGPQPAAAAALVAAPAQAPKAEPTAPKQPPEDDLTKSLRMLEEADREQRAREQELQLRAQELQQREQEQRAAAALARDREAKVRDAQRHEEIKRELDSLGVASARRSVKITMYSTRWCGVCTRARAYMDERRIPYTELDVEHDAAASARHHALNPRGSVPTTAIDDEVLIGFSSDSLEKRIDRAARRRAGS